MSNLIDAKVILNDESKMLDQVATTIEAFAKAYAPRSAADDDFELNNLNCWAKELRGYSDINKQFAAMPTTDLKAALQEEIEVLQQCLAAIKSNSAAAEYWKTNLSENIYYTQQSLARVK
jgi:hypothetical protein